MKKFQTKPLLYYVIITYCITWLCWITAILMGYEEISFFKLFSWDFNNSKQMILFFIFRIGVYGPLLASVLVTFWRFKRDGLKNLWRRIIKWNVPIKWYLYLLLIPIGINLFAVLAGVLTGLSFDDFFQSEIPWSLILIYFSYQIITSGMEEPGWRGFALGHLQNKYTAEKASWILGLIWAIWHYPLLISLYHNQAIISIIFSLAGFTMVMIGQTIIYTWFYNNTKSIFITILHHAWGNTATAFILGTVATHNPMIGLLSGIFTWAIAALLLKIFGGETLTKDEMISMDLT
ncbi:MAG: type II CAAX endopeptidase family protein [candidate division KSB1 bacterium]|nr:type II CAAX endopeptidase family protein [candidate division KSB1 bacterium]